MYHNVRISKVTILCISTLISLHFHEHMLNASLWWQTDCICTIISRNSKKNKTADSSYKSEYHTATVNSQWPFWCFLLGWPTPFPPPPPPSPEISYRSIDWLIDCNWMIELCLTSSWEYFSEAMIKLTKVIVPTVVYFFSKCHNTGNTCKQIQAYIF